jgi:hypothetical protein
MPARALSYGACGASLHAWTRGRHRAFIRMAAAGRPVLVAMADGTTAGPVQIKLR